MSALATATEAPWRLVRCPCGKVLDEVRGAGGETRRRCRGCRNWWIVDVSTGSIRPEPSAAPIDEGISYNLR